MALETRDLETLPGWGGMRCQFPDDSPGNPYHLDRVTMVVASAMSGRRRH